MSKILWVLCMSCQRSPLRCPENAHFSFSNGNKLDPEPATHLNSACIWDHILDAFWPFICAQGSLTERAAWFQFRYIEQLASGTLRSARSSVHAQPSTAPRKPSSRVSCIRRHQASRLCTNGRSCCAGRQRDDLAVHQSEPLGSEFVPSDLTQPPYKAIATLRVAPVMLV